MSHALGQTVAVVSMVCWPLLTANMAACWSRQSGWLAINAVLEIIFGEIIASSIAFMVRSSPLFKFYGRSVVLLGVYLYPFKLNGVSLVDNRPYTDYLQ